MYRILSLLALLALSVSAAQAGDGKSGSAADHALGKAAFSEMQRRVIDEYYRNVSEEQLARRYAVIGHFVNGAVLPVEVTRRLLPDVLEARLPPAPDGFQRIEVGDDVMLVRITTGVIADIFRPGRQRPERLTYGADRFIAGSD